jgi:hypothetical protein
MITLKETTSLGASCWQIKASAVKYKVTVVPFIEGSFVQTSMVLEVVKDSETPYIEALELGDRLYF